MATAVLPRLITRHAHTQSLWRRWTLAMTAGELLGFAVPALVGALAVGRGMGEVATAAALVAAGVMEGAVLGWAQWMVLRRWIQGLGWKEWVGATAAAA